MLLGGARATLNPEGSPSREVGYGELGGAQAVGQVRVRTGSRGDRPGRPLGKAL